MTYPRSSPGVLPTVSGRKSFQQNRSLERSFGQRLDSSGDRVGLQTPLGGYPGSSQVDPAILQTSFFTGSLSGSGAGNFSHVDEGGYRGNFVPGCIPGLLRPLVLRPEGIRWSSPGFGFVSSECFSEKNSFSHGDRFVRPFGHPARGLGDSDRSQGRLFPRPDSSSVSQMAQIHLERQNFPIQGSSLWAQPGPLGVYSDRPGSLHCGSFKGYSSGSIPGRLDDFSGQPVSQQRALYGGRQPSSDSRLHPERQEVFPHPFPNIHVPGNEVRHCINVGTSYPRENRTVCFSPRPIALPSAYNGTVVSCSSRPNRVPGSIGPPRPCPQKGIATTIQEQVAPGKTALGRSGPSQRLVSTSHRPVDANRVAPTGRSYCFPGSAGGSLHGCVDDRLGSARRGSHSLRHMASRDDETAHQLFGDGGRLQCSEGFSEVPDGQVSSPLHRQHYCGLLCQQGGGVTLSNSFTRGGVPTSTLPEQQHCSQSKTCGRKNQHSRRLSESARDDSSDRMDACPFRASTSLGALAQTHGRFVCDPIQQQTSDLCVPGTRSEGSGNGRSVHQLGGDVRIRVPTLPYSEQGYQEGQDRQSLPHSDCTNVASTTLVSGAPRACSSTSTQTERRKKRPPSAKIWHTAPKPGQAVPSRLAGVRKRLRALGASRQLCDLVSKSHRSGTNAVYSSHWKRWLSFCNKQGISPSSPSELDLGNFLAHLSQDCGLSASSLRVYRAAVSTTLRQLGSLTFSDSSLLRDVIRGASNRDARAPRRLPAWDLFLVLASLREAPYEPLFSSDLKSLTCKTVFLIALASGRRASEVCNLSGLIKDIATQQDGSFILKFLPEFLAKNQDPSDPSPCIVIRPLTDFCPDDPDLKLCPVRSLKRYLKFTRSLRKSQRKLFISFNPFHSRDISTASISRWLKLVIKSAYTSASLDINSVRAHEIRAWAASTAFAHSWSMRDVLGAAYWRSESPFISYYLRDVSLRREDGTHGISFVAAQQVISCRRH